MRMLGAIVSFEANDFPLAHKIPFPSRVSQSDGKNNFFVAFFLHDRIPLKSRHETCSSCTFDWYTIFSLRVSTLFI